MALDSLDGLVLIQKIFRTLCTDRTCASPSYRKVRLNVMNTVDRSLAHFFEQLQTCNDLVMFLNPFECEAGEEVEKRANECTERRRGWEV